VSQRMFFFQGISYNTILYICQAVSEC